jgi:hypothetical protein
MANEKPACRLTAVAKDDNKRRVELMVGWRNKYGFRMSLSRPSTFKGKTSPGVAKIVLTDGRTISPDSPVWLNLEIHEEREREEGRSRDQRSESDDTGPGDRGFNDFDDSGEDIPF